jgi:hypothetical protein
VPLGEELEPDMLCCGNLTCHTLIAFSEETTRLKIYGKYIKSIEEFETCRN